MKAIDRNREIYEATGITVAGLPEQYQNDHPMHLEVKLDGIHKCSGDDETSVIYDITFVDPEIDTGQRKAGTAELAGFLTFDIGSHPKNRQLLCLMEYLEDQRAQVALWGRQYDNRFYVTAIYPADDDVLDRKAYFYFIKRIGLQFKYSIFFKPVGSKAEAEENYALFYKVFRKDYPETIRRYVDAHLSDHKYRDSIQQFITMDWRTPTLDLPTKQEARRILDATVYGLEEVKERLLEFLETIRRSGTLAKNLLLVGPPGTGKTTLLQAIAKMLRLPMSIVPLGGCVDTDAFVGFARTWLGAQEGLLTTALMSSVLEHPDGRKETVHQIAQVLFLNEIDKAAASGNRGSIQPTLLRMIDDNRSFFDAYHQAHIDLSNVVIVADANDTSKIQTPILDRFEIIEIPPYTEAEKAVIFRNFTFPKVLKAKKVERSEVSVTREAVDMIVASDPTPGIREQKKIAERIVGNYLLHHSWRKSTVHYTPEMVKPFLPKQDVRRTMLALQPGSIRAVVLAADGVARNVDVQCMVTRSGEWKFQLFGSVDPLLQQELEAAALCACRFLPDDRYDVKVQIYGLPDKSGGIGQLGFPVLAAILSAKYHCVLEGVFHGGTTLLGGLTSTGCDNPDAVMKVADQSGVGRLYTATGFSERMKQPHRTEAFEFFDAGAAVTVLFGNSGLMAI